MASDIRHQVVTPATCTGVDLDKLVAQVRPLFTWYSPGSTDEKIRGRLTKSPEAHVDIFFADEIVAAFAVCVPMLLENRETVLFRHGTIIDDAFKSRGLYKKLIQIGLDRHRPTWHATRTQNPRVYETWQRFHGASLLPSLSREPTPQEKAIARELAHGNAFEENAFISRRVYKNNRQDAEYHECRSAEIRAFFERSLGVHDAFILLARV